MGTIAALHWHPKGKQCSIDYMLLDDKQYSMINQPKHTVLPSSKDFKQLDKVIEDFFDEINARNDSDISIEYKTVITQSTQGKHRDDSLHVDELIREKAHNRHYKEHKVKAKLKSDELEFFKRALEKLNKLNNKDKAYMSHLWSIALHVTQTSWEEKVQKLWKKQYGIKRMRSENKKEFKEFIRQIKED